MFHRFGGSSGRLSIEQFPIWITCKLIGSGAEIYFKVGEWSICKFSKVDGNGGNVSNLDLVMTNLSSPSGNGGSSVNMQLYKLRVFRFVNDRRDGIRLQNLLDRSITSTSFGRLFKYSSTFNWFDIFDIKKRWIYNSIFLIYKFIIVIVYTRCQYLNNNIARNVSNIDNLFHHSIFDVDVLQRFGDSADLGESD